MGVATSIFCRHIHRCVCPRQPCRWGADMAGEGAGTQEKQDEQGERATWAARCRTGLAGSLCAKRGPAPGAVKMQQGSGVSETPASGAGPEQPFPWASFPPCSCSELPPAREHRTESPGPCGRTQMCTARFPGLRSTQIPTNDPVRPAPRWDCKHRQGTRGPDSRKQPGPSTSRGCTQAP